MKLKEFIEKESLIDFAKYKSLKNVWNRISIDNYESIENGFILYKGNKTYRVTIKKSNYDDEYVYYGEIYNYGFDKIPCMTRTEEKKYPKCVGWIGTLLADRYNKMMSY